MTGITLHSMPHPESGPWLPRLWFRIRNAVWPYDVNPKALEEIEIELPTMKFIAGEDFESGDPVYIRDGVAYRVRTEQ